MQRVLFFREISEIWHLKSDLAEKKLKFIDMAAFMLLKSDKKKLDPVGLTVRYEMMKLCTGSVQDTMRR